MVLFKEKNDDIILRCFYETIKYTIQFGIGTENLKCHQIVFFIKNPLKYLGYFQMPYQAVQNSWKINANKAQYSQYRLQGLMMHTLQINVFLVILLYQTLTRIP